MALAGAPLPDAGALLDAPALAALVAPLPTAPCGRCGHLRCAGWESVTAPLGAPLLQAIGTLRDPAVDDPTLSEHHADGTGYWHPRAPISVAHFPFNRCSAWRCPACGRGFLQYTEAGGYYVDHRLREIDPALVA